ncbi:MAG: Snf7 family protein [Candidatus Methanomethylicaceae archaeon]
MPEDLKKRWQPEDKKPISEKIRDQVAPPPPLKERLELAKRRLSEEIQSLDRISKRLESKDRSLYEAILKAYENHDTARAATLANELAELRKVESKTHYGRYALEKAYTKIEIAKDFGELVAAMAPMNQILKNVKTTLADFLPASSSAIGDLSNLMTEAMTSFSNILGDSSLMASSSDEAEKILKEAAAIAESRLKEKLQGFGGETQEIRE